MAFENMEIKLTRTHSWRIDMSFLSSEKVLVSQIDTADTVLLYLTILSHLKFLKTKINVELFYSHARNGERKILP